MIFTARIRVMPKPGVLDPQGHAVLQSLETMGFAGLDDVRLGKHIEMVLDRPSRDQAVADVDTMCQKLLANLVIESYDFDIASST